MSKHAHPYSPVHDNDREYDGKPEGKHVRTEWDDDLDGSGEGIR